MQKTPKRLGKLQDDDDDDEQKTDEGKTAEAAAGQTETDNLLAVSITVPHLGQPADITSACEQ